MNSLTARFGGIARIFGPESLGRLERAHVAVLGVGGVGSWTVESLARSGIGQLTLVDLDDVCISNVNRQLHALDGEFGRPKVEVLQQRVLRINPECRVHALQVFFLPSTEEEILARGFDYIVDAIDSPSKKTLLIARCREKSIPVVTTGAAAGRTDPTAVRISDLTLCSHDRLLQQVRKQLRNRYHFPRGKELFQVPCVHSTEPISYPEPEQPANEPVDEVKEFRLDCDSGFGTASFVTGAFGLAAAAHVVRQLALPPPGCDSPIGVKNE